MDAKEYRQLNRKDIKCPSGLELTIRKITSMDYLRLGILPDTMHEALIKEDSVDVKAVAKIQTMFLTRGVLPKPDFVIVDKDPKDCGENEIAVNELAEDDIRFIITEISLLTFGSETEDQFRGIQE